jgi:hypothetical protein
LIREWRLENKRDIVLQNNGITGCKYDENRHWNFSAGYSQTTAKVYSLFCIPGTTLSISTVWPFSIL